MMQGHAERWYTVQGMDRTIWWGRNAIISCVSDSLYERNQGIYVSLRTHSCLSETSLLQYNEYTLLSSLRTSNTLQKVFLQKHV